MVSFRRQHDWIAALDPDDASCHLGLRLIFLNNTTRSLSLCFNFHLGSWRFVAWPLSLILAIWSPLSRFFFRHLIELGLMKIGELAL